MYNFDFCTPTRILFGRGTISETGGLIPSGINTMILYGGGSIKRNGVYDMVFDSLKSAGVVFSEFGGIEPNPKYETCLRAAEKARAEKSGFLLAVGGGSVLDAAKFIAASLCYGGDPWDFLTGAAEAETALPIGAVMTLPATGSEMNGNAVISRASTSEKLAMFSEAVIPRFAIIDPSVTFSLPIRQTVNGIVDTYVHVVEQYATRDVDTPLQDLSALAIIRTLVSEAPKVLKNPCDYNARANLSWCAALGLNCWIAQGVIEDWSTHAIGHELTAFYGIDHAQSLAIVLPRLWLYKFDSKKAKLAKLAREVWKIGGDDVSAAHSAIVATVDFFHSIGMRTTLSENGINAADAAAKISERFAARGTARGEDGDIDAAAVRKILMMEPL